MVPATCVALVLPSRRELEDHAVLRRTGLAKTPIPSKRVVIEAALRNPLHREHQPDGRYRFWIFVAELGRYLRVVTLEDGETVHNAFPDRNYREVEP